MKTSCKKPGKKVIGGATSGHAPPEAFADNYASRLLLSARKRLVMGPLCRPACGRRGLARPDKMTYEPQSLDTRSPPRRLAVSALSGPESRMRDLIGLTAALLLASQFPAIAQNQAA